MRHIDWEDVLNNLEYQKSLVVEIGDNKEDYKEIKKKLKLISRNASRKTYRRYHKELKQYKRLVKYLEEIESSAVLAYEDEKKVSKLTTMMLELLNKSIIFVKNAMKIHVKKIGNLPTIFWFLHPSEIHPKNFKLGEHFDVNTLEEKRRPNHLFVNSLNRLYDLLRYVDKNESSFVYIVESKNGVLKSPPELMSLISNLDDAGKLYRKEVSFPNIKSVNELSKKVEKKFGFSLKHCRHVLCGMSVPNCVSFTATMLYHSLLFDKGKPLQKVPTYALRENIFVAPQFLETTSTHIKFFGVKKIKSGFDTTDKEIGYVPTIRIKTEFKK